MEEGEINPPLPGQRLVLVLIDSERVLRAFQILIHRAVTKLRRRNQFQTAGIAARLFGLVSFRRQVQSFFHRKLSATADEFASDDGAHIVANADTRIVLTRLFDLFPLALFALALDGRHCMASLGALRH